MSSERSAGRARPASSAPSRVLRAWRELPQERRLAAMAAVGLFMALFLPWYQETVFANGVTTLRSASSSLTGWGAFSFVEAAVLLVAAAVLVLLFSRAEGQAFHVPGGDGGVITAAGFWTCVLIVWRIFDKQGTSRHGQIAYTSGIEWGIFVALGVAAVLTYAGSQIRLAHDPEPPLPGDPGSAGSRRRERRHGWRSRAEDEAPVPARPPRPGPDMGAEDDWTQEMRVDRAEAPTRRVRPRSIGRSLDRREVQELEIAEPPTARLTRAAPAGPDEPPTVRSSPTPAPAAGSARGDSTTPDDDHLTIRLDRPE